MPKKKSSTTNGKSTAREPEPVKTVEVVSDPGHLRGGYANLMQVTHTAREFVFDFFLQVGEGPVQLISRVVTSPAHAQAIVNTLTENVRKYEKKFGHIEKDAGQDVTDLGTQELRLLAALAIEKRPLGLTIYRADDFAAAKQRIVERKLARRRGRRYEITKEGIKALQRTISLMD